MTQEERNARLHDRCTKYSALTVFLVAIGVVMIGCQPAHSSLPPKLAYFQDLRACKTAGMPEAYCNRMFPEQRTMVAAIVKPNKQRIWSAPKEDRRK